MLWCLVVLCFLRDPDLLHVGVSVYPANNSQMWTYRNLLGITRAYFVSGLCGWCGGTDQKTRWRALPGNYKPSIRFTYISDNDSAENIAQLTQSDPYCRELTSRLMNRLEYACGGNAGLQIMVISVLDPIQAPSLRQWGWWLGVSKTTVGT